MGNCIVLHKYTKFNNNNEFKLAYDMCPSSSNSNYLPKNIDDYGINTKISLLGILTNLLNNPNRKILGNNDSPDVQKMYDILKDNIIKNLKLNIKKVDKIVHYNDKLEVIIGKYIFKLIAKRQDSKDDRLKLLLSSRKLDNTNERMMIYYRSNSEGGLWRFAVISSSGGFLKYGNAPKGNIDYITETFINMDLQQYIYENLHKVPFSYYNDDLYSAVSLSIGKLYYNEALRGTSQEIKDINSYISRFNILPEDLFNFRNDYDDVKYPYFNILRYHIFLKNIIL